MKARRWLDGVAFLGFGALALLFTYPLVLQLNTHLAGAGDDMWIFYWNNGWTKKALLQWTNPYWTPYLYFPDGASLVYHSFSWTNTLLAMLIEPLVGPFAAYNLVVLLGLALSGWALYVLVVHLTGRRGAAFVAGIVFAFVPYRITQASHPFFVTVGWLPLFLLFLLRAVEEGRLVHALVGGLFLALTGWTGWHLFIYAWMALGIYVIYLLLFARSHVTRRTLALIALTCAVALALVMPLLFPLLRVQLSGQADESIYVPQEQRTQTDLLAYVVPNRLQPVYGHFFTSFYDRFKKNRNYVAFLGFSALGLAALGVVRSRKAAIFWVLLGVFYGVMALGPVLRFNGQLFPGVPMPYRLIGWTPVVRLLKQPDRFNVVLSLPLAVLVGHGVHVLQSRPAPGPRRRSRWVVPAVCGLLIGWEYLCVPIWTTPQGVPPFAYQLRDEGDEFAVLDLPIGRTPDKRYLYYQTVHQKPIVGGHISRPLPGTYDFIETHPLLCQLFEGSLVDVTTEPVMQQVESLAGMGIRYVVLHKGRSPADLEENWRNLFSPWQIYEDEWVCVYRTGVGDER